MPLDDTGFVTTTVAPRQTDGVLQLLERGLARVKAGWCKKEYYREVPLYHNPYPYQAVGIFVVPVAPQYCALGGIIGNRNPRVVLTLDESLAMTYLTMELPYRHGKVDTYNDDPATTQGDIIALYERAIASRRQAISHRP